MSEIKDKGFVYISGTPENTIQTEIAKVLEIPLESVQVSQTSDRAFGDYTSPISMKLGRELRTNPIDIANKFVNNFVRTDLLEKVEAVRPGYLNFYLSNGYLKDNVVNIDETYGKMTEYQGKKVMVEYGQPNTHKAVTVGHVKSAITGLSLARLYESLGYEVIHANYFGDLGPYVAKTLYSLFLKTKLINNISDIDIELVESSKSLVDKVKSEGGNIALKEYFGQLYSEASKVYESDDVVTGIIKEINTLLFSKENALLNDIYQYTRDLCIEYLNEFFESLGVKYDRQYPESEVSKEGLNIVKENIGKVFFEDEGAVIFKGKDYKLSNWVFLTSEGNPTYSGKELGLIQLKFKEYPDLDFAIVLTSVEQNEYFKGVIKAFELIHPEMEGRYKHKGFGWLLLGNKKTSSRLGTVSYEDMMSEAIEIAKSKISQLKEYSENEIDNIAKSVAVAGFKFNILSHELHKDVNYDPKTFLSLSGYSAPYIVYSYTRVVSILKKVGDIKEINDIKDVLNSETEMNLMRKLVEFPEVVKTSGLNLTPHILCEYLYELANSFNSFYTTNRIVDAETEDIKFARALLASKTSLVIKKGLYLLGIDVIEKM